jgi:hypothetical protein
MISVRSFCPIEIGKPTIVKRLLGLLIISFVVQAFETLVLSENISEMEHEGTFAKLGTLSLEDLLASSGSRRY